MEVIAMWWGEGHWFWGTLMMVVAWSVVAACVYLAVRGNRSEHKPDSTARQLLDERFVKGEISAEEHAEKKATLEQRWAR